MRKSPKDAKGMQTIIFYGSDVDIREMAVRIAQIILDSQPISSQHIPGSGANAAGT